MVAAAEEPRDDHIAIVGMACRFPGADTPQEFWRNLATGVESVTRLTEEELEAAGVDSSTYRHPRYVPAASLVEDMEGFDARFFGYTPREAEVRDPQGRMFLETCHAAIEDSGYDVTRMPGQVGVFGGMANNFYGERNVARNAAVKAAVGNMTIEVSNSPDYLATTVSYRLGLRGPSVNVQTACSTALVAVHLAAQALRAGECDYALAGGVEVELPYRTGYTWTEGDIYSRTGHIRPFDAEACGTLFGTGSATVALKRLGDAQRDRDHIYGIIRGSAVNNDGGDRAGFTAPGVQGQVQLITEALAVAEVHPDSLGFVEAHATGTLVGDPIEVAGLTQAFRAAGSTGVQTCPIGSVKANIGHLGPAAGMAGLIKVCMSLEHEAIAPNINFDAPNPRLELDTSPFFVNTELRPWKRGDRPRRAGVSSFGIGGTNAHLIIEEPPPPAPAAGAGRQWLVLAVSGRTSTAAEEAARRQGEFLAEHPEADLADVAATLQTGRTAHQHRRAVVARSVADAAAALQSPRSSKQLKSPGPASRRQPVLMFPGQGSQHVQMGAGLYRTEPVFRSALDSCADLLTPHLGLDLRTLLYPDGAGTEQAEALLRQTRYSQPALFAVSYAQAELLRSLGLEPAAMIGHSVGEFVAAHLAGVFTLADALAVIAARGRLMNAMEPGGMLAVAAPEAQVAGLLAEGTEVAAVNGRVSTVVSGPLEAVAAVAAACESEGLVTAELHTSHAFHSWMMEPCLAEFTAVLEGVERNAPRIPFISNASGTWITEDEARDPGYWALHLRLPVRFGDGLTALTSVDQPLLVEAGPGDTLSRLARQAVGYEEVPITPTMRPPRADRQDDAVFADALARMWVNGAGIDWDAWLPQRRHTPLPTYPFERQRYWVDPDPEVPGSAADLAVPEGGALLPADRCTFAPDWKEAPPPSGDPAVAEGPWLVFASDHPAVEALASELAGHDRTVTEVRAGAGFERLGPGRFTMRPESADDLEALMDALSEDPPTEIVHAFALTEPAADPVAHETAAGELARGFYSLLHLGQRLDRAGSGKDTRLHVVSSNLQRVSGTESLEPAKAALLGPALLMEREVSGVSTRCTDLALPSALPPETLARQLVAEFAAPDGERQTAWRGLKRWRLDYRAASLTEPGGDTPAVRPDGTYLITGGFGGIGLALAEDLAAAGPVTLALMGRSAMPPQEEWPALAEDAATPAPLREKLRRLRAIEERGATVVPIRCDVSAETELTAALAALRREHGPVRGVFHSAGVAGGGMMAVRGDEDAARVLAPKIAGTLALYRLLGDEADFMMLFSSVIAVTAPFGQVDYCAANNFLDRFAPWASDRGLPVVSIGWSAWSGFGMAADTEATAPQAFRDLETGARSEPAEHPLLDRRIHRRDSVEFTTVLKPEGHWVTSEHRIGGTEVVVGAALLEMVDAAYRAGAGGTGTISEVVFLGPIPVSGPTEVRVSMEPDGDGHTVTVASAAGKGASEWTDRMRCRVDPASTEPAPRHDLAEISARCAEFEVSQAMLSAPSRWVSFGPRWTDSVKSVSVGDGQELARIEIAEEFAAETAHYRLHPALFDSAVHSKHSTDRQSRGDSYLPLGYHRIRSHAPLPPRFWVHIRHVTAGDAEVETTDLTMLDDDGNVVLEITGYAERRIDPAAIRATMELDGPEDDGEAQSSYSEAIAEVGITAEVGLDVLRRIVRWRPEPHLVVSPEGLHHGLRRSGSVDLDLVRKQLGDAKLTAAASATPERTVDTPYAAPETEVQRLVAGLWGSTLGVSDIGLDDDFFDLGGNSLVAVQLAARLRDGLSVALPIADLFDNPTVRTLSDHLVATGTPVGQEGAR